MRKPFPHPSPHEVQELLDRERAASDELQLLDHINQCGECQAAYGALLELAALSELPPTATAWKRPWRPAAAGIIALACLASFLWRSAHVHHPEEEPISARHEAEPAVSVIVHDFIVEKESTNPRSIERRTWNRVGPEIAKSYWHETQSLEGSVLVSHRWKEEGSR